MRKFSDINKPLKNLIAEHKYKTLTGDPENQIGHNILRKKYGITKPNQFPYGRAQGGISNLELEKLGIGQR